MTNLLKDDDGRVYDVKVAQLLAGYCRPSGLSYSPVEGGRLFRVSSEACSITLIEQNHRGDGEEEEAADRGKPLRVLVDCGSVGSEELIEKGLAALRSEGLVPADITHLVLTHWHYDHTGNIGLFPNAEIIEPNEYAGAGMDVGRVVRRLSNNVEVLALSGHTRLDLVVMVRQMEEREGGKIAPAAIQQRVVCVAGDIFECEDDDLIRERLWRNFSLDPEKQLAARTHIMNHAQVIVPGHGWAFASAEKRRQILPADPQNSEAASVVLIRSRDSLVLVNSGGRGQGAQLVKELESLKLQPGAISHLVVAWPAVQTCHNLALFPNAVLLMSGSDFAFSGGYFGAFGEDGRMDLTEQIIVIKPRRRSDVDSGTDELVVVVKEQGVDCEVATLIGGRSLEKLDKKDMVELLTRAGCSGETRTHLCRIYFDDV